MKFIFFSNGNTACFDEKGKQLPEYQVSWAEIYKDWLNSKGVDIENMFFELPNRTQMRFKHPDKKEDKK